MKICGSTPFLTRVQTEFAAKTILNSAHSRAHLSYFCSYANLPVIVEATHRHSNSSVHINVPLTVTISIFSMSAPLGRDGIFEKTLSPSLQHTDILK